MIAMFKRLEANDVVFGVVCVLVATLGLSTKAIFIKLVYQLDPSMDAVSILAIRFLVALPFFILLLYFYPFSKKPPELSGSLILQFSMLGVAGFYLSAVLDFTALAYIPAGLERLILFLYPTFVVLISMFLRPKEITRQTVYALVVSYAGMIVVFSGYIEELDAHMVTGALLVLAAAITFAVYTVASVDPISRYGSIRFTGYAIVAASIGAFVHSAVQNGIATYDRSLEVYALIIPMALFSTFLPLLLMAEAVKRIGASNVSVIGMSGPVVTLCLAYFFLGETYGLPQLIGGGLIIYGVYMVARGEKKGSATPS